MFTTKKIAIVSVINDLASDHRVHKTCAALIECGYGVLLIGRKLPDSPALPHLPFVTRRMRLLFHQGPLFYFFFNLRLLFFLLFRRADLLYSNDLDTLLPNYLISRIKNIPLIYDSHELFTEVPELIQNPAKRKIWKTLENWLVPKLKHCITVNQSIAQIFEKEYGIKFHVIRNIPDSPPTTLMKSKKELGLPEDKHILILQGAGINIDRGAEELVDAMKQLKDCFLLIIGSGDVWPVLKKRVLDNPLNNVLLIDRLPKQDLLQYTMNANLGISIDKNTNLNYYYSLPNKIFDYIHAGLPILATRLPEIERIIMQYTIGDFISNHHPETIAQSISEILYSPKYKTYTENTAAAREAFTWNTEKQKLKEIIRSV